MKKLFISCPMRGRTKENIEKSFEKMKAIAEAFEGEELEVIPTVIREEPPKANNEKIWYLGKSIEKMADADIFIGIRYTNGFWCGCEVETTVARFYGIKTYFVDIEIFQDALDEERAFYDSMKKTAIR